MKGAPSSILKFVLCVYDLEPHTQEFCYYTIICRLKNVVAMHFCENSILTRLHHLSLYCLPQASQVGKIISNDALDANTYI